MSLHSILVTGVEWVMSASRGHVTPAVTAVAKRGLLRVTHYCHSPLCHVTIQKYFSCVQLFYFFLFLPFSSKLLLIQDRRPPCYVTMVKGVTICVNTQLKILEHFVEVSKRLFCLFLVTTENDWKRAFRYGSRLWERIIVIENR
jgi:hypothetical protein